MKAKLVLAVVAALAAIGLFAGTAEAGNGKSDGKRQPVMQHPLLGDYSYWKEFQDSRWRWPQAVWARKVLERIETLEEQNADLAEALAETQAQLKQVKTGLGELGELTEL